MPENEIRAMVGEIAVVTRSTSRVFREEVFAMSALSCGVDIGSTNVKVTFVDECGQAVWTKAVPTRPGANDWSELPPSFRYIQGTVPRRISWTEQTKATESKWARRD